MAGYTRQSVADIIANAVIKAAPVNAEFNAIRDAFNNSTGHKHDGTSAEGTYVPLIADLDGKNKVVVDTTNNRISFYNEVSSTAVEQLRLEDGVLKPVTDDDIDLGATGAEFKDLYIDGIGYIDSVVITGGTIDATVIGGTTPAAADFTTMDATGNATVGGTFTATGNATLSGTLGVTGAATFSGAVIVPAITGSGLATLATVDINGGAIDNTTIGASTASAGSFTTVTTTGQATLATVDINGGAIDGAVIGAASAAAITGTTITGTSLVGPLTGNTTGNVVGNVTGNLSGNVTGNVTAASGTSSFTDVTINGTLNMNAGTTATITNLTTPVANGDAANKLYVDTAVATVIDSAPGALDTLNELAAALGDDANFSTTITTSIATKLPLAGGTMTGPIAMGTSKITGLGDPTANQDAVTKAFSDSTYLGFSGGTMTGAINMGSSKVTTSYTPTDAADLTTKTYVDTILGSATAAATSATNAATSETNAATSATNSANSATAAAGSATSAANSYDAFDDRYLGAKSSAPATDNDGDAIITGALYFDTSANLLNIYNGSSWAEAGSSVNGTSARSVYTATSGQTTFSALYDVGFVDVYLNGVKLVVATDFTATNGTTVVLATGATAADVVDIIAYGSFSIANVYTQAVSDARFMQANNNLSEVNNATTARTNLGVAIGSDVMAYDATILNDADIGVNVQAFDTNIVSDASYVATANDFTTVLKGKLDGIEALADVTDTTNVTAAGALMDSEVTNLSEVKAFTSVDYATAAQGALANSAIQPNDAPTFGNIQGADLTLSGDLIVNGTTTTVNSTTLDVADLNITVASGAANAAAANGAGITVTGASATMLYTSATDTWDFNKAITGTYTNLNPVVTTATVNSATNIPMTSPMQHTTMSGAMTFTPTTLAAGRTVILVLDTSATPHTPSWNAAIKWPDATEPTWADSRYWIVSLSCLDGTNVLASASGYTV